MWRMPVLIVLGVLCLLSCSFQNSSRIEGIIQLENADSFQGIRVMIPGTQYQAITNDEGQFIIEDVPPDVYSLIAEMNGYESYREEIILSRGKNVLEQTVILKEIKPETGTISGFITIPGEATHEGIVVMLVNYPISATTNMTGFFELKNVPIGTYSVLAFIEGWLPNTRDGVNVAANANTKLPDLQLTSTASSSNEDRAPDTETLGNQIIQGYAFLQGSLNHGGISVSLKNHPGISAITNATGFYVISGVDANLHTLVFSHEDYITEEVEDVEPVTSDSRRMTSFVTLRRTNGITADGILQGNVFLQGAENHADTIVRLVGISQPVVTDGEGKYMFVGIQAGIYELVAVHQGYSTKRAANINVLPGQINQAQDITLEPQTGISPGLGSLSGYAVLEGEVDYSGILVAVEGTSHNMVTGADGFYRLEGIEAGYYNIILTKANYRDAYIESVLVTADEENELETVMLMLDVDSPYVVETFPLPETVDVPIAQWVDVLVKFSDRMNGDSVKEAVMIDPPVSFEAFFDRESELSDIDVLHLRLHQNAPEPVFFNTIYNIVIMPFAQTPEGVQMEEPFEFSFQTGGPLILGSVPGEGVTEFLNGLADPVMIETNAPVNQNSVLRSMRFRPRPESEPIVTVNPIGLGSQVLIYVAFKPDTRYQIQFDQNLRTMDGMRFSNAPYTITFTTRGNDTPRGSRSGRQQPPRRGR